MNVNKSKEFREKIRVLERSLNMLNQSSDTDCSSLGLSQCHALIEIGRKESIALKELALTLQLDASTTSRTVDALVKKGLVNRTPSEIDRRSIQISLTEAGHALFVKIESDMDQKFDAILTKIDSSQHDMILNSLELILTALKK